MRRRLILPLLLVLLGLILACTERGSLPSGPELPEAASPWRQDYPLLFNQSLYAVWGMDADDMWAGGSDGVFLHYDGQSCTRVASPTDREIESIHGRARHDVWAESGREILHWDGRRWDVMVAARRDSSFDRIWCTDDGEVFVGGRVRHDDVWHTVVFRHDGARWWTTELPVGEADYPDQLWQPAPGGPLLLAINERLYRYGNSRWTLIENQIQIHDADGALALGRPVEAAVQFLYRFDAAGNPYASCPEETLNTDYWYAYDLADARSTVLEFYNRMDVAHDCVITTYDNPFSSPLYHLTVPENLRPDGTVIFGVGNGGLFVRGTLTDAAGPSWQTLVPEPRDPLRGSIIGNADLLFGGSGSDRLLVRESGVWRSETHDDIPPSPEFILQPDGRLVAWNGGQIAVRRPDGTWYTLPELPRYMSYVWTDGIDDGIAYNNWGIELTLAGGQWAETDSLDVGIIDLQGRSADEVYRLTGSWILERRAGDSWEPVLGDANNRVNDFYLSPWSHDIYVYVSGPDIGHGTGIFRYGAVIDLVENNDSTWRRTRVCEARPGDFYIVSHGGLERLTTDGWQDIPVSGPNDDLDTVWGHPSQGLFVRDFDGRLFHRPFPGTGD